MPVYISRNYSGIVESSNYIQFAPRSDRGLFILIPIGVLGCVPGMGISYRVQVPNMLYSREY